MKRKDRGWLVKMASLPCRTFVWLINWFGWLVGWCVGLFVWLVGWLYDSFFPRHPLGPQPKSCLQEFQDDVRCALEEEYLGPCVFGFVGVCTGLDGFTNFGCFVFFSPYDKAIIQEMILNYLLLIYLCHLDLLPGRQSSYGWPCSEDIHVQGTMSGDRGGSGAKGGKVVEGFLVFLCFFGWFLF